MVGRVLDHEKDVVEDRGWELFSESNDIHNLAWTALAVESLQVLTEPDPSEPEDPAPFWNERDSSSGGGPSVSRMGLGSRR